MRLQAVVLIASRCSYEGTFGACNGNVLSVDGRLAAFSAPTKPLFGNVKSLSIGNSSGYGGCVSRELGYGTYAQYRYVQLVGSDVDRLAVTCAGFGGGLSTNHISCRRVEVGDHSRKLRCSDR